MTGSRRTTRTATTLAAFASMAIVALGSPASASGQQGQGWPIKEFEVVAVEPAGEVDVLDGLDGLVEGMMRTIRTETDYDPDFPPIWDEPTVSFEGIEKTKAEIEAVLQEAAAKLESWGFAPPSLEPVVKKAGFDAYRVYLVTGRPHAGAYHAKPCHLGIRETVLVLNASAVLGSDGSLTDPGVQTVVHELVHAAQWSLPSYSCGYGYPGQWVTEGTARAIGFDVLRQLRGTASFRGMYRPAWGARMYSERLPVPLGDRGYRTNAFWRFLAEYTQSRPAFPDGSATWPVDYSYLPRLLGRDFSPRDCYGEGDPCDAELRWIDAGLRDYLRLPLRELYARFMQAYAQYGEERVHSTEGGTPATWRKNWLGASFAHEDGMGCPRVPLRPHADSLQKRVVVPRFNDVAAMCWDVELDGFEDSVTVAVTASYHPGTEAMLNQLTAVMADDSRRVDTAVVRTVADVPEASWYYDHLGTADTTAFLLTNVADQPDETRVLVSLSVTFTALPKRAVASYSGPVEGGGGFGDLADDIAAGAERFVTGEPSVSVMILPTHPGHCHLRMNLLSDIGDMVDLNALLPQPLMEGAYPIQAIHEGQSLAPSSASIQVRMSCDRPGSDCMGEGFGHISEQSSGGGSLELLEVSKDVILGEFVSPMTGHEDYVLAGRFVSPLFGAWGRLRRDHPCSPSSPISIAGRGRDEGGDEGGDGSGGEEDRDGGRGGGGDEDGGGDDGSDGAGGLPGGEAPPEPDGEPPPAAGAQPPAEADEAPSDPDPVTSDVPLGPSVVLDFLENGGSALRSEPQVVQGAGSLAGVAVSSQDFNLTIALSLERLLDCSMEQTDPAGYLELLEVGRHVDGLIVLEIEAGRLRLDAAGGAAEFVIEGNGIEIRGTDPGFLSLESSGPTAIHGDVSAATLEISVDGAGFSCEKLMDVSFTVAEAR